MEDLVSRMRWKLHHTRKRIKAKPRTDLSQSDLNRISDQEKEFYGFRTSKGAPPDEALKPFEDSPPCIERRTISEAFVMTGERMINLAKTPANLQQPQTAPPTKRIRL